VCTGWRRLSPSHPAERSQFIVVFGLHAKCDSFARSEGLHRRLLEPGYDISTVSPDGESFRLVLIAGTGTFLGMQGNGILQGRSRKKNKRSIVAVSGGGKRASKKNGGHHWVGIGKDFSFRAACLSLRASSTAVPPALIIPKFPLLLSRQPARFFRPNKVCNLPRRGIAGACETPLGWLMA